MNILTRAIRRLSLYMSSRREIINSHKTLEARMARLTLERDELMRVNETLIDIIDALRWESRARTAVGKSIVESLRREEPA